MKPRTKHRRVASEIDRFLSGLSASGERDSRGSFTLDASGATRKISANTLESPGDWLVKILQAAFSLGAGEVNVKIGVSRVHASFSFLWDECVRADRLAEAIHRGGAEAPAARHLALALQTANGRAATWRLAPEHSVSVVGGAVECRAGPVEGPWVTGIFELARSGSLLSRLFQLSARAQEQQTLYEHGRFSDVVVKVDGRSVERGWPRDARPFYHGTWLDYMTVTPYYLMEGYLSSEQLPPFSFPSLDFGDFPRVEEGLYRNRQFKLNPEGYYDFQRPESLTRDVFELDMDTLYRVFFDCRPGDRVGVAFALPMTLTGKSSLYFVVDGVSCRARSVDLGLPMLAVASAEGLRTDLSGLSVVEDSAFEKRLEAIKTASTRFVEAVRSRSADYLVRQRELSFVERGGVPRRPGYITEVSQGIKKRLGAR